MQHGNTVGQDCEDGCCLHQSERSALRKPVAVCTPMQAVKRPVEPESDSYTLKRAVNKSAEPKSGKENVVD